MKDKKRVFELELAGQKWDVAVSSDEIENVHKRVIRRISEGFSKHGGRYVVFLAAAPGAGKTTTATIWAKLAGENGEFPAVQVLPMDGFHFPNSVLDSRTVIVDGEKVSLHKVKGSPESFNLEKLSAALKVLHEGGGVQILHEGGRRWPVYDRNIHDPVPDAIEVQQGGIVIVEGNYLLLDEPGWRDLKQYADLTIFIDAPEETVREDLLKRYTRGGRNYEDAVRHYEYSDLRNRRRIMSARLPADIVIAVKDGRKMEIL